VPKQSEEESIGGIRHDAAYDARSDFAGTVARLPGKAALIFGGGTFTHRELERLTNQAANGVKALGVKKDDRVTLFAQNSAEWVITYIGIAKAGAVINPVNAMLTADELVGVDAKPDPTKGEIAKAYIVLKAGASADTAGVIEYCRQHLAAYKVPRAVQFVPALPTTSSGKIMRRELKTLDQDAPVAKPVAELASS